MADEQNDPNGPRNLAGLRGMLPSMVAGIEAKKIGGKGKRIPRPNKVCDICCTLFGKPNYETEVKMSRCGVCHEKLRGGMAAVIDRDQLATKTHRFGFFTPSLKISDMAGKVWPVSSHVFDKFAEEFKIGKEPQKPDSMAG